MSILGLASASCVADSPEATCVIVSILIFKKILRIEVNGTVKCYLSMICAGDKSERLGETVGVPTLSRWGCTCTLRGEVLVAIHEGLFRRKGPII